MEDVEEFEDIEEGRVRASSAFPWHEHSCDFVGVHSIETSLVTLALHADRLVC